MAVNGSNNSELLMAAKVLMYVNYSRTKDEVVWCVISVLAHHPRCLLLTVKRNLLCLGKPGDKNPYAYDSQQIRSREVKLQ